MAEPFAIVCGIEAFSNARVHARGPPFPLASQLQTLVCLWQSASDAPGRGGLLYRNPRWNPALRPKGKSARFIPYWNHSVSVWSWDLERRW